MGRMGISFTGELAPLIARRDAACPGVSPTGDYDARRSRWRSPAIG